MASSHDRPPDRLDSPLELDPADWTPREVYHLIAGLVVPRPIAWISTVSPEGVRNVAPHSFFTMVAHHPPHIAFSSTGEKDTLRNIGATGEFVVNIVGRSLLHQMHLTSADFPADQDEFAWAGVTPGECSRVAVPHVAEAPAYLECRARQVTPAGEAFLVLGEVVHVHVESRVWAQGRVDPGLLQPVSRLAGSRYATLGELTVLPHPRWDERAGWPGTNAVGGPGPGRTGSTGIAEALDERMGEN